MTKYKGVSSHENNIEEPKIVLNHETNPTKKRSLKTMIFILLTSILSIIGILTGLYIKNNTSKNFDKLL